MRPIAGSPRLRAADDAKAVGQAIVGFAVAAMVMIGLGGSVYYLVAPGGLLSQVFGRSVAGGLAAVLAFLIVGLCAWMTRAWISIPHRNRYSEIFVWFFAAIGAIYAVRMVTP